MSEKYLGIKIAKTEELPHDLQVTLERKADFLKIVETPDKERFILHIEFQTRDEKDMILRMQEYFAILRRKHQLPVKQVVLYLGDKPTKMQTLLEEEDIFKGFELVSLRDLNASTLLKSTIPEEIMLAVLANFEQQAETVIQYILRKLVHLKLDEISLRKYIKQLEILSKLRSLNELVLKQVENMPITLDIKDDFVYKEGKQQGIKEGKRITIIEMLMDKVPVEKIAKYTTSTIEEVQQIQKNIRR